MPNPDYDGAYDKGHFSKPESESRTHVKVSAPVTWPAAAAATMISLFVIAGTVLMCLGCMGVFGGRFGK